MKKGWYGIGMGVGLLLMVIGQWPRSKLRMIACDVRGMQF